MDNRNHSLIKVAVIGVGNCASSLIQGIHYYRNLEQELPTVQGVTELSIGGYQPHDIEIVAAFDIDSRKVGQKLSDAIFSEPNCTTRLVDGIPESSVMVKMGKILDSVAPHFQNATELEKIFVISDEKEAQLDEVAQELIKSQADLLINFLPVGSEKATEFYMEAAEKAHIGVVNCIPVFIASSKKWDQRFKKVGLPILGDDIKAQIGATIVHRTLADLFRMRGVSLDKTYQMNVGGNTDFCNMLDRNRLASKKISKTEAVQSVADERLQDKNIHIGPSDFIPWLDDKKLCFLRMEGRLFANVPINIELRLEVEDSPNSAGMAIDAIRCCKLAIDRGLCGSIESASAFLFKHPPVQKADRDAYNDFLNFTSNK